MKRVSTERALFGAERYPNIAVMRSSFVLCAILLAGLAVGSSDAFAAADSGNNGAPSACEAVITGVEEVTPSSPTGVGGGLVLDEHLLTDGKRDQDYNGGGEVTFSGERAGPIRRMLDRALGFVDGLTCPRKRFASPEAWQTQHAFALGLVIFTPGDLAAHDVVAGDRPYASLFFLSAGRRYVSSDSNVAYNSSLTVGMLGLQAAESVQHTLHSLTGSVQPQGWSHQVSAGGEPTLRYSAARQALLGEYGDGTWHGDSKWTVAGSAGTVTEGSLSVNTRWGRIESPWWAFTPEQTMYVQETQPLPPPVGLDSPSEIVLFAGARAKLRAYNAFLQGQFRHSDLTYGEGDLNKVLGEAWAGVEWRTSSGWAIQYLARWESPELKGVAGSRSFTWGSIEVSKTFR